MCRLDAVDCSASEARERADEAAVLGRAGGFHGFRGGVLVTPRGGGARASRTASANAANGASLPSDCRARRPIRSTFALVTTSGITNLKLLGFSHAIATIPQSRSTSLTALMEASSEF